jgi:hypothetical protein
MTTRVSGFLFGWRRPAAGVLAVAAALAVPTAVRAQAFAGHDDFNGNDAKWAYAFRVPYLTVGTNGVLRFNGSTLEFTKGAGMGSYIIGWDGDGIANNSISRIPASFTTSWVAEVTPILLHQPDPGTFAAVGFEVAIAPNAYTEVTLQRATDGILRVFTETNSPTTGIARVVVPDGADVRLRLAWDAASRIITVAYSFDGGASFATLRTVPITEWPIQPSGGFQFELMGYSTSPGAVPAGQMQLDDFSITTVPPVYSRLGNVSVRNLTADGDRTLIVGFTVDGAGSRPLVIRTVSETLGRVFGVPNVVSDVDLALFAGTSRVRTAAGVGAGLAAAFQRVGAFPLDATTTDAAIVASLTAGGYAVHAVPAGGAVRREGAVLVEVYEDGLRGTRLTNLSARTELGSEPLIVGFVVNGTQPARVLVRAVGPGLGAFGLTGLASDPRLTLIRQSDGATIAQNDDWGTAAGNLTAAFASSGAFPLAAGSKDAALVVELAPGAYTARLQNATAVDGVVLAELYQLP